MVFSRLKKWKWLIAFGVYTLIGFFFVAQKSLSYILDQEPIPWDRVFVSEMIYWYIWLGLTPLIFWFSRRITIDRQYWRKGLLLHLLLSLFFAPLQNGLWYFLHFILILDSSVSGMITNFYQSFDGYLVGVLTSMYKYWVLIGAYYGIKYYFQYREQEKKSKEMELQTVRLQTQLVQSRLDVLKMQLHPHFLFNAMNTISVYMKENVEKANNMLIRLSELLRITLESKDIQEVTLRKEFDVLNYYLEVEKARFEDNLEIKWDVEPTSLEGLVPYLFLQPILENAIHHGISTNRKGGSIAISSKKEDGRLIIKIKDNGIGPVDDPGKKNGIGLKNTRERLKQLYGHDYSLSLQSIEKQGTNVTIDIPFRTSASTKLTDTFQDDINEYGED